MGYAEGSQLQVLYGPQTTLGTAYTTLTVLPVVPTPGLALTKDAFTSNVIRSDRQVTDMRHGAQKSGGDMPIEFKYGEFDTLLEGAFFGTWTATSTSVTSTSIHVATGNKLVKNTAWTTAYAANDYVDITGFTTSLNNGVFKVTAVTGTTMTVSNGALGLEPAGDSVKVRLREKLRNGVTKKYYTVQLGYTDIGQYHQFKDLVVGTWKLSVPTNALCTGSFSFTGTALTTSTTTLDSSPTASLGNDSFSGIDASVIYEGGSAIALITQLELTVENGLNAVFALGSTSAVGISAGRCNVTGTATALFQNSTMLNKFLNETNTSLWFVLVDPDGNKLSVDLPLVKYSSGYPTGGGESVYTLPLAFTALMDPTTGYTIVLSRGQN